MTVPFSDFRDVQPVVLHRAYKNVGKRLFDLSLLTLMAPVALPLIALLALITTLKGGQPFYAQRRIGQNGKEFRCWKIRTMVPDADAALQRLLQEDADLAAEWEHNQKLARDPRITRFGALLRKTSLDELPQLLNVLNGSMSLVGPRPFTPEQKDLYRGGRADAEYYRMRPGITGLWQISRRNSGSFGERAGYDSSYWANMGLRTDLAILVATVGVVLRGTGV